MNHYYMVLFSQLDIRVKIYRKEKIEALMNKHPFILQQSTKDVEIQTQKYLSSLGVFILLHKGC